MKAKLEFDLPEERQEFILAVKAGAMHCALTDLDNECRRMLKHGYQFLDVPETLEWVMSFIQHVLFLGDE